MKENNWQENLKHVFSKLLGRLSIFALDMLLQCEGNPFIIFTLSSTSCQRTLDMSSLGKDTKVFDVKLSLIDYIASEGAL